MNVENSLQISRGFARSMTGLEGQTELEGLKNLDSQVIGKIYDRYFADVYRFVHYRLNDEQVAEDISSEVFIRLLEAVKQRRGPQTNIKGWLLSTAAHAATDHLRQAYRNPADGLSEMIPNGNALSTADEVDQREKVNSFRQAYQCLTPEQQNVLALRFGDGYSLEETARIMQKNVNAIKALQFRALAAIQRMVGEVNHG